MFEIIAVVALFLSVVNFFAFSKCCGCCPFYCVLSSAKKCSAKGWCCKSI